MDFLDADRLASLLPWPDLVDAIAEILAEEDAVSPDRHVHPVAADGTDRDVLLLMPAWVPGQTIGVKLVTFFGSNTERGLGNVNAGYMLVDGETGVPVAVMDGEELGSRRTLAASALAARSLARADAAGLLVVGTGNLARFAIEAHAAVRPIERVEVWGRTRERAESIVANAGGLGYEVTVSDDLDQSVSRADVISCMTSAGSPLIKGALLKEGAHLDLIGSFKADMREADDDCARRATVFVDTVAGASLSGDICQPIERGIITEADLTADLRALATGQHPGRTSDAEITMFKSAGFALEDLAAARLAYEKHRSS